MRYLVTSQSFPPFYTFYFNPENHFQGMIVYDLQLRKYTKDGVNWIEIKEDYL